MGLRMGPRVEAGGREVNDGWRLRVGLRMG